jgi:hypothetical protein
MQKTGRNLALVAVHGCPAAGGWMQSRAHEAKYVCQRFFNKGNQSGDHGAPADWKTSRQRTKLTGGEEQQRSSKKSRPTHHRAVDTDAQQHLNRSDILKMKSSRSLAIRWPTEMHNSKRHQHTNEMESGDILSYSCDRHWKGGCRHGSLDQTLEGTTE